MKTNKLLPTAFLVTALLGAGAVVATAQNVPPTAETETSAPVSAQSETAQPETGGAMSRIWNADFGGKGEHRGDRDGGRHDRSGGRHGGGAMMQQILNQADADGDGALAQAEIDAFRTAQVGSADTSGDGALAIEEFETLYNAFTRDRMVDAFQNLDSDGDGVISADEIDARVGGLVERMDRDGDGAISPADRGRRG